MRSVILCEGNDDLWFIAYFLNKVIGWDINGTKWKSPKLSCNNRFQDVQYMHLMKTNHVLAIKSVGGQDRMKEALKEILYLNKENPMNPIDAIILFRDSDERSQEDVAKSMENWFDIPITLSNQEISEYQTEIDEFFLAFKILPVIIPFDEHGAIETLLLNAISDNGNDGKYIVEHAKSYVEETKRHVTSYLNKQRLITKAKFSAAIAIVSPDHSTGNFMHLMYSTEWEKSASIRKHMIKIVKLIEGQLDYAMI